MTDDLQYAIECLSIRDVYMRSSNSALEGNFEPKYDTELENLEVQYKHVVTQSNVLELNEGEENAIQLFRVFVELGARLVLPLKEDNDEPVVMAYIEGVMVAEYQMDNNPGPEALKTFALKNASFHVWPYWREYLSSQCLRMNLPKLVLPTRQFASNQDSE
ncbi:MAG: preprotein translocase subunit SecB [Candidatus Thiodiazotropha sp.]